VYLLHSEANQCVRNSTGSFEFVILNELLDDLPYRAFYADPSGGMHELTAQAESDDGEWFVTVGAEKLEPGPELAALPPGSLTATSAESLELVRGISTLLVSGGMLLIHDYGFADPHVSVSQYESLPRSQPSFARIEFPAASESGFPRAFFRLFGNQAAGAVQITNDVNFAELATALEPTGTVITLPHGNSLWAKNPSFDELKKGDGVFLGEFAHLGLDDDLAGQLNDLRARQASLRKRYANEHSGGVAAVFNDLIYVKR
jgi:SAM-dependent MidA family methyltransferase